MKTFEYNDTRTDFLYQVSRTSFLFEKLGMFDVSFAGWQVTQHIQRFYDSKQQSRDRYQSKFKLRDALFAIVKDVFPCSYYTLFPFLLVASCLDATENCSWW